MPRLYRLIFTGKVSLYLSAYGAIGAMICVALRFLKLKLRFKNDIDDFLDFAIGFIIISIPAAFCISFGSALAVLFDPPWFKRPKRVLIRIAIALIITFVIAATATILFAYLLKTK